MQLSFDTRGNSVPTILLLMQHRLYALGGLQVSIYRVNLVFRYFDVKSYLVFDLNLLCTCFKAEGIFRINPDNGQEEYVRDQLNRGLIPDDVDVHCLAGLIKVMPKIASRRMP